ncbi:MAG: hypothetical protein WC741_02245 [Patescibacteria group bacterium]|jgi:hypothetical protein
MDSSKNPTTKFFLLNPTKGKIIISLFDSLIMILISLIIPSLGFQSVFLSKELSGQIFFLISNLVFSSVIYYPFACGIVYLFKIITGKEKVKVQNLAVALLFIIIFNIVTFSIIATKIMKNNQVVSPKEKLCGLQIMEVTAPSAKNAGLLVGEVIKTIDGFPVDTMDALTHALANKKPNNTVTVITNFNTYNVSLFANPQNPQHALLGIKVKPTECKK